MATALCIKCGKKPQTSADMKTCDSCRRKIHRKMKQTLRQIFESAERTRIAGVINTTVAASIDYETGKVERADKQHLVDAGLVRIAGIKPSRRPSRIARTKARAAGIAAQAKLRDRRRMSSTRQLQHAHA